MPNTFAQKLFPTGPLLNITLASGHQIKAMSLHVSHTYGGLLEGVPSDRMNRLQLEWLAQAMNKIFGDWPLYIVPPEIERPPNHPYSNIPERAPAFYPPLEIAAKFECRQTLEPGKDGSLLVIAWYQHSFPPVMSPNVQEQVEQIPWPEYARDFEV